MWEDCSLYQANIHTPLCTVKCYFYARYPGQTFWHSLGSTDKDARVWWDTDLPFPSSTGMPLTVEWWMVAHTSHTFAHVHAWHTSTHARVHTYTHTRAKVYKQPSWSGQPGFGIASHTRAQNHTKTGVLTVALPYSEPGVGGRGNKVVFISCSLGVL